MLIGLLMVVAPCLVFVATLPLSRYLGPKLRKVYRISGGLIVFLGGTFTLYLASYTGDQGGIAAYFFQITVILVYAAMSLAIVAMHWILRARESGETESETRVAQPVDIVARNPIVNGETQTMKDDALCWKKLRSEAGPELPLFQVRFDTMQHPTTLAEFQRLVLEAPDWVTVVAITTDGQIVMVEQYRFGVGELTIEPVAGIVDRGEESRDAGKRELLEETGFGEGTWRYLGSVQANPAFHNNLCHHWLVEDAVRLQAPTPDAGEAIRVHLMTLNEIRGAIAEGKLKHPLGLSALSRVFPLWELPYLPSST